MTERRKLKNELSELKSLKKYYWHCDGMMDVLGGRPESETKEDVQEKYDDICREIQSLENTIKEIDDGRQN